MIAAGVLIIASNLCAAPIVTTSRMEFSSGGKRIAVDRLSTPNMTKKPTVLVLNGAGGMIFDGPEMRRVARRLAEDGNTALLVHYFDRTGTLVALDRTMQANFETWLGTVRDSIAWAQARSGCSRPIGIYGYSLGAFLALAVASDNPRVGAIVEQAGGIWNGKEHRIGRMPPTLVVHGKTDARVPFDRYAGPLISLLSQRGRKPATKIFPSEGHVFSQNGMEQVRPAAAAFFRRHLRRD